MPIIGNLNPTVDFVGPGPLRPGPKIPFVPGTTDQIIPGTEKKKEISTAVSQLPSKFKAYTDYVDASSDLSQAYQDYVQAGGTQNKAQWGQQHYKDFGKDELREGAEAIEYATREGSTPFELDAQLKQNLITLQGNIDSDIKNMELEAAKYMQKFDLQSKEKLGKMNAMTGMLGSIWSF
jgi:hypothetical protein